MDGDGLDLAAVRARFEASTDLTLGVEEEYQLLDPETLALTPAYERLSGSATGVLADAMAGELIRSEIEIRTGRAESFADAVADLTARRRLLAAHAAAHDVALCRAATHPTADWRDQEIIDTAHYRRVAEGLRYVAWRNNTFSLHLHVGVRGADRAIAVCDRLRADLPTLLALSASSPWAEGRYTYLHSTRTQLFTRNFPRCGVPDAFGDWATYAAFVSLLERTGSIRESTQIWWSVRPAHTFGTVEIRICDGQVRPGEAMALVGLMVGLVASILADLDDGRPSPEVPARLIEENLWRAERHGLDGRMIDPERGEEVDTVAAVAALVARAAPFATALGLTGALDAVTDTLAPDGGNAAQRAVRRLEAGEPLDDVFADVVAETFDEERTLIP